MMCQVTSMSRTFSTSSIVREVIQANGQRGSNQNSALGHTGINHSLSRIIPTAQG